METAVDVCSLKEDITTTPPDCSAFTVKALQECGKALDDCAECKECNYCYYETNKLKIYDMLIIFFWHIIMKQIINDHL